MSTATTLRLEPGDRADIPGLGNRLLATGEGFSLVEHTLAPRALGAPVHTHLHEDECSYVVSGRIGVRIGSAESEHGPGEAIFKPRGVPHTFWNPGGEPAVLVEVISPGGFEQYFAELGPLLTCGVQDPAPMLELAARYGLSVDLAATGEVCERHRVGLGG